MNVLSLLQVQIQVAVTAALSLSATGICCTRLANATQAGNHGAAIRFPRQVRLNRAQQFVGSVAGKALQFRCEWPGLDEFHDVIVPQCGIWCQ